MEKTFADEYGRTGDSAYAAWKAGSKSPVVVGAQMRAKPALQDAARESARRLLREDGTLLGVQTLMQIASDQVQPAGARVTAATNLIKLGGIASDEANAKDLSEMTGEELAREIARATARQAAAQHVAAERARPVLEGELAGPEPDETEAESPFD